jgi:oligopeptide/dipeptide ABC transporter ATP-binding protein
VTSALSVQDLCVDYESDEGVVRAVSATSFELEPGATMGLVGESGSGKTTLAMSLMGLLPTNGRAVSGRITLAGSEVTSLSEAQWRSVRWSQISLVFQGGMNALNPVKRVIEQIAEPILEHSPGVSKAEARSRAGTLLERVGIPAKRGRGYPHEFSGGMRQRVGIAMALACKPQIVIADEPVTALDVVVQAQIMTLLRDLQQELGLALLVITHDLGVVAQLCDNVIVMYAGEIVERGSVHEIFADPKHPYTSLLLASVPRFTRDAGIGYGIPGSPPSLAHPPTGCKLHPRCPHALGKCGLIPPPAHRFSDTHVATCHLYDE